VKTGESSFTIEVAGKPVKAGIDPVVKLVDRRPDDNTVSVTLGPAEGAAGLGRGGAS
jgi:hypothetical protein